MKSTSQPPRPVSDERGNTLIEGLAALAILGFALGGMLDNMSTMTHLNSRSEIRSQATVAARVEFERLRLIDPKDMPDYGNEERDIGVDKRTFRVVTNYCTDADICDDVTRQVIVEVFDDSERLFDAETVYTRLR